MKFSQNILISLLIATSFSINMQAFQDSDASAASFITVAATAGGLCCGVKLDEVCRWDAAKEAYANNTELSFNAVHAVLGAIVVGGVVWFVARNTPAGLLRRAKRAFPINAHLIDIVRSDRPLIPTIEKYYILHTTPLASSFRELAREYEGCRRSVELLGALNKALETMPDSATKAKLISEGTAQTMLINSSMPFIDAALTTIKQQAMFLEEQRAIAAKDAADAASSAALSSSLSALASVTKSAR